VLKSTSPATQTPADPHGDDEVVGDVRVLDEELAAAEPPGHGALERDRVGIERATFFHQSQRRDALAGGQRRKQALLLRRARCREYERRRHHRARDERAGQADLAHLLDQHDDVE